MGVMYVEGEICPITGDQFKGAEFGTISCCHCQAIIRIAIKYTPAAYEARWYCSRCHGWICEECKKIVEEKNGGQCTGPTAAKIDKAIATGEKVDWRGIHTYR